MQNDPQPPVVNATWAWRLFNCHVNGQLPDTLHDQGGMAKHYISLIVKALGHLGQEADDAKEFFDQMFIDMPHFNGQLHFTNGICHLTGFTGGRWRAVLRVLPCVMADIFPIPDFTKTVVAYLDFYVIYSSKVVPESAIEEANGALVRMVAASNNSFFHVSPSEMCFIKNHKTLGHALPAIRQMGAADGYSAGPLENAHICSIKVPHRATSGAKAEEQMINYINRHHTFEGILGMLGLLLEAQKRGYVPGGEWDEDIDGDQQIQSTALVEAALRGSPKTVVKIPNYAGVHCLGGDDENLRAAYGTFETQTRIYLYEHDHKAPPPEGERGYLYYLPDLDTHVVSVYPTLQLPLSTHPYVSFSQTMRCLVPGLHLVPTRMDNVAVRCPPQDGNGGDVICIGQLLLLFTAWYTPSITSHNAPSSSNDEYAALQREELSLAHVWWYDEDDGGVSDASECTSFRRSYQSRAMAGSTRNQRVPWTEVVPISKVLYRVHMIPKKAEGSWEASKDKFRLNKWVFLAPA